MVWGRSEKVPSCTQRQHKCMCVLHAHMCAHTACTLMCTRAHVLTGGCGVLCVHACTCVCAWCRWAAGKRYLDRSSPGTECVALITEAGVGARQVAAARLPTGPAVCALVHVCKKTSMLDQGVSDRHGEMLWQEHRASGAQPPGQTRPTPPPPSHRLCSPRPRHWGHGGQFQLVSWTLDRALSTGAQEQNPRGLLNGGYPASLEQLPPNAPGMPPASPNSASTHTLGLSTGIQTPQY